MSLVAEKISENTLKDILELIDIQPWIRSLHEEIRQLWNLCESREEQMLIKRLVSDICILDSDKELAACRSINTAIQEWGLSPKSTWVVGAANAEEVDGSAAGLQKLKNKILPAEEWGSRFIGNIPAAAKRINNGDIVVLFDDFIGSGDKIIKKRVWLSKILAERNVNDIKYYYASFSGMRFGIENIKTTERAEVFTYLSLRKGITENFPAAEAILMVQMMLDIESRLSSNYKNKKIADFSLGYGKSEALYCGQNDNCPNNVFPVLWWPFLKNGGAFKTLLTRIG